MLLTAGAGRCSEISRGESRDVSLKGMRSVAEPNILLTRIDNRLIHGQVVNQWNAVVGANLILVANDGVANNDIRQRLMDMAAPEGVAMRYFSLQKTIDVIHQASSDQLIFLVVDNPTDVLTLVRGGVPISKVNVGNLHMAEGRRQVTASVAVDDADVAAFRELRDLGVELEVQRVPSAPVEDSSVLFE